LPGIVLPLGLGGTDAGVEYECCRRTGTVFRRDSELLLLECIVNRVVMASSCGGGNPIGSGMDTSWRSTGAEVLLIVGPISCTTSLGNPLTGSMLRLGFREPRDLRNMSPATGDVPEATLARLRRTMEFGRILLTMDEESPEEVAKSMRTTFSTLFDMRRCFSSDVRVGSSIDDEDSRLDSRLFGRGGDPITLMAVVDATFGCGGDTSSSCTESVADVVEWSDRDIASPWLGGLCASTLLSGIFALFIRTLLATRSGLPKVFDRCSVSCCPSTFSHE